MSLLPLEIYFQRVAEDKNFFPNRSDNYFNKYMSLLDYLRANIYPTINTGLIVNSNDDSASLYTDHGPEHFDEVVKSAGFLLGIDATNSTSPNLKLDLSPYEIYCLLVGIRIHDAGNIHGRGGHNKLCIQILREAMPSNNFDMAEARIIAKIAEAHGGKTPDGGKDTINLLSKEIRTDSLIVQSQLLAGILRIADEICENRNRAANYLISHDKIPEGNKIYHFYAASITNSQFENGVLLLDFAISEEWIRKKYSYEKSEIFLIDYIYERLDKIDLERLYCNRFTKTICSIDSIKAKITIYDENHYDEIINWDIVIEESGYPTRDSPLKKYTDEYNGEMILDKLVESNNEKVKFT